MDKLIYALLIIVIIGLIVLIVITYNKRYKKGIEDFLKDLFSLGFDAKVKSYKSQNKFIVPGGTLFIGDSITQDYNVYEYFSNQNVYNRGIGGDTSLGILKRLDESVYKLKPKRVVLLIGTNDLAVLKITNAEIVENIKEIIINIKKNNKETTIYVQSIYPVNENLNPRVVKPRKNKDIRAINQMLKELKDIVYIDMYNKLADEQGNLNVKYTIEGLHINPLGYELITNYLKEIIK